MGANGGLVIPILQDAPGWCWSAW